jgi:hypothetical protein
VSRRVFVALLLCLLAWAGCWSLGNRERLLAFQAFHGGPYHTERSFQPTSQRTLQLQQFDLALQALQKKSPALLEVKREYLGQPFEETQGLFFTMGQVALRDKKQDDWKLVVQLLEGMALAERNSLELSAEKLRVLHRLEQRTTALYAQARLMRVPFERLPRDEFTQDRSLCHRLLIAERVRAWEIVEESGEGLLARCTGGYFLWAGSRQQIALLDSWHQQIDRGQALKPPPDSSSPDVRSVYDTLLLFSGP